MINDDSLLFQNKFSAILSVGNRSGQIVFCFRNVDCSLSELSAHSFRLKLLFAKMADSAFFSESIFIFFSKLFSLFLFLETFFFFLKQIRISVGRLPLANVIFFFLSLNLQSSVECQFIYRFVFIFLLSHLLFYSFIFCQFIYWIVFISLSIHSLCYNVVFSIYFIHLFVNLFKNV